MPQKYVRPAIIGLVIISLFSVAVFGKYSYENYRTQEKPVVTEQAQSNSSQSSSEAESSSSSEDENGIAPDNEEERQSMQQELNDLTAENQRLKDRLFQISLNCNSTSYQNYNFPKPAKINLMLFSLRSGEFLLPMAIGEMKGNNAQLREKIDQMDFCRYKQKEVRTECHDEIDFAGRLVRKCVTK